MKNIIIAVTSVALVAGAGVSPVQAKPDKCIVAIAAALRTAGGIDLKQAIGGKNVGSAPTSTVNRTKIGKKCSAAPTGYAGCPDVAGCGPNTDTSLTAFEDCLDCLVKATAGRTAGETSPGKCGNATVDSPGEDCDGSGCASGKVCAGPGASNQCHCYTTTTTTVVTTTSTTLPAQSISLTTATGTACNGTCSTNSTGGFNSGAPCLANDVCGTGTCDGLPNSNQRVGELDDVGPTAVGSLFPGCLYFGGGLGNVTPPSPIPDGSTTYAHWTPVSDTEVDLSALEGDIKACSKGWNTSGQKYCWNNAAGPNNDGTCTSDADCGVNKPRTCNPAPVCVFGPPLPVVNGGTSTCILNVISGDISGQVDPTTGESSLTLPLASMVFLTGNSFGTGTPCPRCVDNTCNFGPKQGQACTTTSSSGTTLDCPPVLLPPQRSSTVVAQFIAPLAVKLGPAQTSQTSLASSPAGIFCPLPGDLENEKQGWCAPGDPNPLAPCDCDDRNEDPKNGCTSADTDCGSLGTCSAQPHGGAFGDTRAVTIKESGQAPGPLTDHAAHAGSLGAVFCLPPSDGGLIDGAADLPGPGAVNLPMMIKLNP